MLYKKPKKDALAIHEKAVEKYEKVYAEVESVGKALHEKRHKCLALIDSIEAFINSIANHPKELETAIADIRMERKKFSDTEKIAEEVFEKSVKVGVGAATAAAGGVTIAGFGSKALMWLATTFGTTSKGVAVSTLHGAAATNAAYAWLGHIPWLLGAPAKASGKFIAALTGPVGWTISFAATAASTIFTGTNNKKAADKAIEEAKEITMAGAKLHESQAQIQTLIDKTTSLYSEIEGSFEQCKPLQNADYLSLSEAEQKQLGALVNNTFSLAELLNKTV